MDGAVSYRLGRWVSRQPGQPATYWLCRCFFICPVCFLAFSCQECSVVHEPYMGLDRLDERVRWRENGCGMGRREGRGGERGQRSQNCSASFPLRVGERACLREKACLAHWMPHSCPVACLFSVVLCLIS